MMPVLARNINSLRAGRHHLEAQVAAGIATRYATLAQAEESLACIDQVLLALEEQARALPECAYLFPRRGKRGKPGRTVLQSVKRVVTSDNSEKSSTNNGGTEMARKPNVQMQSALEEVLVDLRHAEKSAGSTKWALSGAGAAKTPPSTERAAALTGKLAGEQAKIAKLRAQRDALKAKIAEAPAKAKKPAKSAA